MSMRPCSYALLICLCALALGCGSGSASAGDETSTITEEGSSESTSTTGINEECAEPITYDGNLIIEDASEIPNYDCDATELVEGDVVLDCNPLTGEGCCELGGPTGLCLPGALPPW